MNRTNRHLRNGCHRRRGVIFITVLGIIIVLTALVLVFARNMRTEELGSANRLSAVQADAVERAAENWVQAFCDTNAGDSVTITSNDNTISNTQAVPVGNSGYFWILQYGQIDDSTPTFGITDECGKINLNTATSNQLLALPNMTENASDPILDWVSTTTTPLTDGAKSDYYNGLQEPYDCKMGPFETVEELLLVKGITPYTDSIGMDGNLGTPLWGYDRNHNGVIEQSEANSSGGAINLFNDANSGSRGFFNDVTVYSVDPSTLAIDGTTRVNVNTGSAANLTSTLTTYIGASRAAVVSANIARVKRGNGRTPPPTTPFANMYQFYTSSGMTPQEFSEVSDYLTASTGKTTKGVVNVNTAPAEVLEAIGISQADAENLVAQRLQNSDTITDSVGWAYQIMTPASITASAKLLVARSFQYSADIVAVSADGRAFKRMRIVVDCTTAPAKILYRKDLTSLGWPLPASVQQAMRAGQAPPIFDTTGTTTAFGAATGQNQGGSR